ncbi:MAG: hypothetical protein Q7K43_06390 [Candidatus Woesearchaeota archaeon]|nr:hypothetical protein [Candidatus Woesearchaeota archaeon]
MRKSKTSTDSGSVLLGVGILGFVISAVFLWQFSPSWAFAFSVFFAILIATSLINTLRVDSV